MIRVVLLAPFTCEFSRVLVTFLTLYKSQSKQKYVWYCIWKIGFECRKAFSVSTKIYLKGFLCLSEIYDLENKIYLLFIKILFTTCLNTYFIDILEYQIRFVLLHNIIQEQFCKTLSNSLYSY